MEIVVCLKPVPDAETRLRPRPDGAGLDPEGVKFVLAGYDESAVEQALLLKEATPGSRVHALSCGPPRWSEEVLRAAIALGCDAATAVEPPSGAADDPIAIAGALRAAIDAVPHDLVLMGKQAGDDEEGLVPGAVAELLGVPHFGFVVDLRWDAAAKRLRFERSTEAGQEKWEAAPPCVIALQQAWNDPRTAKLPAILKSRRAPIGKAPATAPPTGARNEMERFALPPPRSGAKMIEFKTPAEAAEKLVRLLKEEAKVMP